MEAYVNLPKVDRSEDHIALAKKYGFFVENRGKGSVFYFMQGTHRKASIHEEFMWQTILQLSREIKSLSDELVAQLPNAIQAERNRISTCIARAAKELSLHQPTLALVDILVSNENAETDVLGAKELT